MGTGGNSTTRGAYTYTDSAMALDVAASLKVLVTVLVLSGAVWAVATFFEGATTGRRALRFFGIPAAAVGAMQIFELRYAPLVLLVATGVGLGNYARARRQRSP